MGTVDLWPYVVEQIKTAEEREAFRDQHWLPRFSFPTFAVPYNRELAARQFIRDHATPPPAQPKPLVMARI